MGWRMCVTALWWAVSKYDHTGMMLVEGTYLRSAILSGYLRSSMNISEDALNWLFGLVQLEIRLSCEFNFATPRFKEGTLGTRE